MTSTEPKKDTMETKTQKVWAVIDTDHKGIMPSPINGVPLLEVYWDKDGAQKHGVRNKKEVVVECTVIYELP